MAFVDTNVTGSFVEDRDTSVSIGIDLPFRRDLRADGWFATTKTTVEAVKNNIRNLILTNRGERVFQPSFGSNLRAILFDSFDTVTSDNIDEAIREAVSRQLPYITINEVNVVQDGQNENSILVSIEYSTTLEPDTLDSLTLQFNIGE